MPDILSILEEEGLQRLARSVDDVAELIDATPWSSDFSWSQLKMLAKYVQVFLAPDGEKIVREGDHENYLCVVVDGRVRVQKSDCCDRPKVIAILGPGKTLGEMSLVDGEPRSASIVAEKDTTLLVLDEADFEVMKREHPALALQVVLKIAELLSQRLRSTSGRLVDHLE
jgi:CRP/FNR family transcriptional regulator, cyclic AMP receptor protein